MKVRRYKKIKSSEKSKYRFSKLKSYTDNNEKKYFYEGKYGGCFQFLTIDKDGNSSRFHGYEKDIDNLNLSESVKQ